MTRPPTWLVELHKQFMSARGARIEPATRPFTRPWDDLLDDAGIASATDRETSAREAEKLPQLKLHRRKGRSYQVIKVELPLESEPWLHGLFGTRPAIEWHQQSLHHLENWTARPHPLLPELWTGLMQALAESFHNARVLGPFHWREPGRVCFLLDLLYRITAREWPEGTLIRHASDALFRDSKQLELEQASVARALTHLFGRETPLEALGIQTTNSTLHFSGPLTLHFPDGTCHESTMLRFESSMSATELERAIHITTTADQLLTVENHKTTFLQLARADQLRSTLIVSTSFPTQAVRQLLQNLPATLPHFHFGDTDAAGFQILQKLRQLSPRRVQSFQMHWRDKMDSRLLTRREEQILDALLHDPAMADCHSALGSMRNAGRIGDFKQESLKMTVNSWPFYG